MPIYEYECAKCGHHTEVLQKFSDPPVTKCDLCNGKMKKLISQSTFHLKGTGWYVTDYASKSSGAGGKTTTSSPKEDKNTGKNESKASSSTESSPKKDASTSSAKKSN